MSYIRALQTDLAAARTALAAKDDALTEFLVHLDGPKFHGLDVDVDVDGGRKDWIAVADVVAWLRRIREAGA